MNDRERSRQAKAYLMQAYRLMQKMKLEQDKIEHLRSKIEYKSPSFEGMGGSCGGAEDKMSLVVAEIVAIEQDKASNFLEYARKYKEIERAIGDIDDDIEKEILERRYLLNEPWESSYDKNSGEYRKGIADKIGYSVRNVYKKHGSALLKIKIPESMG